MIFTRRPFCRFPVLQCDVTYDAGLFQGQGIIWSLSCVGWRFSGDLQHYAKRLVQEQKEYVL